MTRTYLLSLLLALTVGLLGCQPSQIVPEEIQAAIESPDDYPHATGFSACNMSEVISMIGSNQYQLGTFRMYNNETHFVAEVNSGPGMEVFSCAMWIGNEGQMPPMNNKGQYDVSSFGYNHRSSCTIGLLKLYNLFVY